MAEPLTAEQVAARWHSLFCGCGCTAPDVFLADSHELLRAQLAAAEEHASLRVQKAVAVINDNLATYPTDESLRGELAEAQHSQRLFCEVHAPDARFRQGLPCLVCELARAYVDGGHLQEQLASASAALSPGLACIQELREQLAVAETDRDSWKATAEELGGNVDQALLQRHEMREAALREQLADSQEDVRALAEACYDRPGWESYPKVVAALDRPGVKALLDPNAGLEVRQAVVDRLNKSLQRPERLMSADEMKQHLGLEEEQDAT